MDCIIDYESYQSLKQSYDQLVDSNQLLESENESLTSSNRLLKRLLETLETIKTSLEQKVLIMTTQLNGIRSDQLVPFDRELQRLDEDYCHLKCLLNRVEFDEEVDAEDVDTSHAIMAADDSIDAMITSDDQLGVNHNQSSVDDYSAAVDDTNDDDISAADDDNDNTDSAVDQTLSGASTDGIYVLHPSTPGAANDELNTGSYSNSVLATAEDLGGVRRQRNKRSKADVTPGVKRFRCPWNGCEYATDSSGNFQKHYRIHTGEKPYRCDFEACLYSCSDPGSIKEHKRIHSTEKQFRCEWEGCTWKFSTYKLLKNHKRACHTLEKPHKCDWPGCDKSFLAPYALRTHKLKHTGIRPHKCDMFGCTASFARPTDLARHKRETHCTERQYLCEHENCGSKFYRKDDLRHHIRRKHDCPQFGRRAKRLRKGADSKEMVVKKGVRRKLSMKTEDNSAAEGSLGAGGGGTGSDATEGLDEPKVVIDLNVAKVNQLRKSIQINFV